MIKLLLLVFSVFDSKASAFLPVFMLRSNGEALRLFQDEVNREGSEFWKHPEDYTLFRVGEFDQETGELVGSGPVSVATAVTLRVVA